VFNELPLLGQQKNRERDGSDGMKEKPLDVDCGWSNVVQQIVGEEKWWKSKDDTTVCWDWEGSVMLMWGRGEAKVIRTRQPKNASRKNLHRKKKSASASLRRSRGMGKKGKYFKIGKNDVGRPAWLYGWRVKKRQVHVNLPEIGHWTQS